MFWYIWFSVIIISTVALMIISRKREFKLFEPSMFFTIGVLLSLFSILPMVTSWPSPKYSTLIETLPIEQLNTNKYILIDGEEYSFKSIATNKYGIEETEVFTTEHYFTRFIFDSSIAPSDSFVQVYKPTTSFWYPEWLNFKGRHNFYVITLPDQDVFELSLNYWEASD